MFLEMPLGKVPVLEVNGVKISESLAISRYIGKEYGKYKFFVLFHL